ncbi:MAG: D-glycero-beta-D-manno-heptose 1,7-bisphosphate 7-phosphatase [Nanoarchaeota archaeon]
MNRAIFLDRDGTINIDNGYTHKTQDLKFYPDVFKALSLLKRNFKFIIITNQSGIGRGYYTEDEFHKFNNHIVNELKKNGIEIKKTYYCPHHPDENCNCRKPNISSIKKAEKEFNIDLNRSWMIGDHPCDMELGKNAGVRSIYLLTGHGAKHLEEARKFNPDYIAAEISQAADYILFNKEEKIIDRKDITSIIETLRREGKSIVTINGTFDILHKGHEFILKEAKKQGDILIVGLNSDSSVKQNKGPERPLNSEQSRARMLANFDFVDYVVLFNEKTPIDLLEAIKPDIHVNGDDYGENCIESGIVKKNSGKIHIVKKIKGISSTNIIESISKT